MKADSNTPTVTVAEAMAADGVRSGDSSLFDPGPGLDQLMNAHADKAAAAAAPTPPAAPEPVPVPRIDPRGQTVPKGDIVAAPVAVPAVAPAKAGPGLPGDILNRVPAAAVAEADEAAEPPVDDTPPEAQVEGKARSAWANVKRENKAYQAEIAKLKAELERRSDVPLDEVAELKRQNDDYEAKLGRLDLSQSREFKERYDNKLVSVAQRAASLLQRTGKEEAVARQVVEQMAQANGDVDKIQELLVDETPAMQSVLMQSALDISDIVKQRNLALEDWKATRTILDDGNERQQTADVAKQVVQSIKKAVEDVVAEGSWMYVASDEDEEWNTQRDDLAKAAQRVLYERNPDEVAKYVLEGLAASRYRKLFETEHLRAEQLSKELNDRVKLRPGLGSAAPDVDGEPKGKPVSADPRSWLDNQLPTR